MIQTGAMSILDRLKELEKIYNITVLFAVEAGDKAFGLDVPDTLSTVRFIYKHPIERYLKLTDRCETIEWVDKDVELYGIDLRKAVEMIAKSNRQIYEWTSSSVKYLDRGFGNRLASILKQYFSKELILPQYQTVIRNQLEGVFYDRITIRECLLLEKTFLQIKYILATDQIPPVDINELLVATKTYTTVDNKREISHLIHEMNIGHGYKPYTLESKLGLNIKTEYESFLNQIGHMETRKIDLTAADDFFLQELNLKAA